jgi:hypothetical protein
MPADENSSLSIFGTLDYHQFITLMGAKKFLI